MGRYCMNKVRIHTIINGIKIPYYTLDSLGNYL